MKPPGQTYLQALVLFSRNSSCSSFNLPVPPLLGRNPGILKDLDRFKHFPYYFAYLLLLAAVPQFRPPSFPRISRTLSAPYQDFSLSVLSSDQVMTSQMTPSSYFPFLDKYFGPVHLPGIFMYLLPLSTPHASILFPLLHTTPFDASFPLFSGPQKFTFLSASV